MLIVGSNLGNTSCSTGSPQLQTQYHLFGANSSQQSLYRKDHDNYVFMKCSDPQFDQMVCITKDEYVALSKEIIADSYLCEKWK